MDDLPETPPAECRLGVVYELDRWTWRWTSRLVARQDRVSQSFGEMETPGFTTHGMSLQYRFGGWMVMGELSNLTDKAYAEHLSRRISDTGLRIAEPGRRFFLGIRTTF